MTNTGLKNGKGTKRKRGGRAPGSGDDVEGEDAEDWTRQRKDNHVSMVIANTDFLHSHASLRSRKRSSAVVEEILMMELMSLPVLSPMVVGRKPKFVSHG